MVSVKAFEDRCSYPQTSLEPATLFRRFCIPYSTEDSFENIYVKRLDFKIKIHESISCWFLWSVWNSIANFHELSFDNFTRPDIYCYIPKSRELRISDLLVTRWVLLTSANVTRWRRCDRCCTDHQWGLFNGALLRTFSRPVFGCIDADFAVDALFFSDFQILHFHACAIPEFSNFKILYNILTE